MSRRVLALCAVAAASVPGAAGSAADLPPTQVFQDSQVGRPSAATASAREFLSKPRAEDTAKQVAFAFTQAEDETTSWWQSGFASLAATVVHFAGAPEAAQADSPGSVSVYFGQGCFWHVQHESVKREASLLNRTGAQITAVTGYAGGTQVGDKGQVCYHNTQGAPDYGKMGHAEVVGVVLPADKVGEFAKGYFDEAAGSEYGRHDPRDLGGEYRSVIGLPGGVDGPLFKQLEAANAGRMQLLPGKGNDTDTVATKNIWVYDSDKFPFYQGEVYHQFHDDMVDEKYSEEYHQLKGVLLESGRLHKVDCPEE